MPSGSKTGGTFVHHPPMAHDQEVRGQIRLLFDDVTGHQVQIQRTLLATQKVSFSFQSIEEFLFFSLVDLEKFDQYTNIGRSNYSSRN